MPQASDISFGERLRRLREAAGLTQEELAERAGLRAEAASTKGEDTERCVHNDSASGTK